MIEFIEQAPGAGPPAPVPIIQDEDEFSELLALYRERRSQRVLEIGTYAGGTLFHWLQNANPGTLVVSLDLYEEIDNSHLYDEWCSESVGFVVVRGDSNDLETAEAARDLAPYDWLFIDAGHLEHQVRRDWELYEPMVRAGGVVAFHDIRSVPGLERVQVAPLWHEIKERYTTQEIMRGGMGIGVVFLP